MWLTFDNADVGNAEDETQIVLDNGDTCNNESKEILTIRKWSGE